MDLIKYEFYKEEDGAYYHFIGQLVKKVRYYREQVSINEFEAAIPELKAIEKRLQDIDISLGETPRQYLAEIMNELNNESALEEKVVTEIDRLSKAITLSLFDTSISLANFSYEYRNANAAHWLIFYGYATNKKDDGTLIVIKEVFRSVCYSNGIIFIDSSLSDKTL